MKKWKKKNTKTLHHQARCGAELDYPGPRSRSVSPRNRTTAVWCHSRSITSAEMRAKFEGPAIYIRFSPPFSCRAKNERSWAAIAARWFLEKRGERGERWTERAGRRRPSERLAAPPRESRDVTESPLFFAIPRRAPRARKVPVPPRGSLLSVRDALLLSAVPLPTTEKRTSRDDSPRVYRPRRVSADQIPRIRARSHGPINRWPFPTDASERLQNLIANSRSAIKKIIQLSFSLHSQPCA